MSTFLKLNIFVPKWKKKELLRIWSCLKKTWGFTPTDFCGWSIKKNKNAHASPFLSPFLCAWAPADWSWDKLLLRVSLPLRFWYNIRMYRNVLVWIPGNHYFLITTSVSWYLLFTCGRSFSESSQKTVSSFSMYIHLNFRIVHVTTCLGIHPNHFLYCR